MLSILVLTKKNNPETSQRSTCERADQSRSKKEVTAKSKHEMTTKFDEVCVFEKVLEITLFSDPTWTFERKYQLASFGRNRCQVSRTQKIQLSKVKTKNDE